MAGCNSLIIKGAILMIPLINARLRILWRVLKREKEYSWKLHPGWGSVEFSGFRLNNPGYYARRLFLSIFVLSAYVY